MTTRFEFDIEKLEEHIKVFKKHRLCFPVNIKYEDDTIHHYIVLFILNEEKGNELKILKDTELEYSKYSCMSIKEMAKSVNKYFKRSPCNECCRLFKIINKEGLCEDCNEANLYKQPNIDKVCSICMEEIISDFHITRCKHSFHSRCLFKKDIIKCPNCREKLYCLCDDEEE